MVAGSRYQSSRCKMPLSSRTPELQQQEDHMPDRVLITMITRRSLHDATNLARLLDAFEQQRHLLPTHWGLDERAGQRYERSTLIEGVSELPDDVTILHLQRRKQPRYSAYVSIQRHALNDVHFVCQQGLTEQSMPELYALGAALAQQLTPEFAFVHSIWDYGERSQAYSAAGVLNAREFQRYGLSGICARTW